MNAPIHSGIYAILDLDRLSPALPDDPQQEQAQLMRYIRDAINNGAKAVQLRAKSTPGHSLWLPGLVRDALQAADGRVPIIMNDHVEPIEALGDIEHVGIHVGQDDATPSYGRNHIGPRAIIGLSTHNLAQVQASAGQPVDYIGFGPVNDTGSKNNPDATAGFEALAEAVAASVHPVVAIGGLGLDDVPRVVASGARSMAVITAWLGNPGAPNGPNFARMAMRELTDAWTAAKRAS